MKEKLREMREKMKENMAKEKKITITLEDYSAAVDIVIKQMTILTTSEISKSIVKGIVSKAVWDLWDRLRLASDFEKFVDNISKVADRLMEEEERKER